MFSKKNQYELKFNGIIDWVESEYETNTTLDFKFGF